MLATPLPDIPISAFRTCVATGSFHMVITPHAISVVFGELSSSLVATASLSWRAASDAFAFCAIVYFVCFNGGIFRLSSLFRTIVADSTLYFIMAMGLQTVVLFFLSFAGVRHRPLLIFVILTHSPLGRGEPIPTHVRTPPPYLWNLTNPWYLIASM
jgi:hypothetical protein